MLFMKEDVELDNKPWRTNRRKGPVEKQHISTTNQSEEKNCYKKTLD